MSAATDRIKSVFDAVLAERRMAEPTGLLAQQIYASWAATRLGDATGENVPPPKLMWGAEQAWRMASVFAVAAGDRAALEHQVATEQPPAAGEEPK